LRDGSRLECLLARLTAQKAWLELAALQIRTLQGPVLEIGLGKGRTFDHLRRLLPDRRIIAYDGELHAPAAARPDPCDLVLGNFRDTLPRTPDWLGSRSAALIHADFGSEDTGFDAWQAEWLGPLLEPLIRPGGIVIADRTLRIENSTPLAAPQALSWPYFGWRVF
jgi:hypothetical protein